MGKWATFGKSVVGGLIGVLLGLLVWRAYVDYTDFMKMRAWVGQMQTLQAEQAKAQQQRQDPLSDRPETDEDQLAGQFRVFFL